MKRIIPLIVIFFILLFLPAASLFSQAYTDTITVDLQLFLPDAGILYLNDLGLMNMEHAPLLFSVTITNYFAAEKSITLKFGILRGNEILIEGTSEPFILLPHEILFLTSQNILSEKERYAIQNIDISAATEDLKNTILATGKLPTGLYRFFVEVDYKKDDVSQKITIDQEEININSPTILDLVSPGSPTDSPTIPELYTNLPFFQWESNAAKYEITVCEKLKTNSSPYDVMKNEPRVQKIVEGVTYFQYPSDAWELEEGKTYYWQVVAIIPSGGGETRLESEIWGFKIAEMSGGTFSAEHEQLLSVLRTLLGDHVVDNLFKEGGPLAGFTFTGSMQQDGERMTLEDLNTILNKKLNSKIDIKNYVIE